MSKAIIPKKLIIEINDDGTFKSGILQYRISIDGVTDETKYYSVGIDDGMDTTQFIQPLIDSQRKAPEDCRPSPPMLIS